MLYNAACERSRTRTPRKRKRKRPTNGRSAGDSSRVRSIIDSLLLHDTSNKIACDGCDRGLGCHLRAISALVQRKPRSSNRCAHPEHGCSWCNGCFIIIPVIISLRVYSCVSSSLGSAASSLGRTSPPSSTGASVLDGTAAVSAGGAGGAPAPHVGHPPGIAGAAFPCIACDSSLMIANASSSCASFSASFCLRPSYVGRPVSLTCSGSETQTGPLSASAGGLTLPNQRVWTAPAWVLTRTTAGGQA